MSPGPPAFAVCEAYRDLCSGNYVRALRGSRAMLAVARGPSAWMSAAHLGCIAGQALLDLDRPEQAAREIRELLARNPARAIPSWRARMTALLATAEADRGEIVESLESLAQAVALVRSETWLCPTFEAACVEVIVAHGRMLLFEQAEELMQRIGASVDGRRTVRNPVARRSSPHGVAGAARSAAPPGSGPSNGGPSNGGQRRGVPPPVSLEFWAWTFRAASFLRRQTLLRLLWAARLEQVGLSREADRQHAAAAALALRMYRLSDLVPELHQIALAIEIYTSERLGQADLARAAWLPALMAATEPLDSLEWALARMAVARACARSGELDRARSLLDAAARITESSHCRGHWHQLVRTAQAQVASLAEEHRRGSAHPADALWQEVHRAGLLKEWQERTALLADLKSRTLRRQLDERGARTRRELLIDPLTGLGNRRRLTTELDQGDRWSALFLDLDTFKQVNDQCGHDVGDEVLRRVAQILRSSCRAEDVLVRYGGDEFVVLVGQQGTDLYPAEAEKSGKHHDPVPTSTVSLAKALAERILTRIRAEDWTQLTGGIRVTASIGVAGGQAVTDALNRSDAALRAAKRAGRDALVQW
jgi:GGDEF domain-containing protein